MLTSLAWHELRACGHERDVIEVCPEPNASQFGDIRSAVQCAGAYDLIRVYPFPKVKEEAEGDVEGTQQSRSGYEPQVVEITKPLEIVGVGPPGSIAIDALFLSKLNELKEKVSFLFH